MFDSVADEGVELETVGEGCACSTGSGPAEASGVAEGGRL